MELCRLITLTAEGKIVHSICPINTLPAPPFSKLVVGPVEFSFDSFRLAALLENTSNLARDFHFAKNARVLWSVKICDQVENMPLFKNTAGARALLLLGETINCLFEGFHVLNHDLVSVAPNINQHLDLTYDILSGTSFYGAIGRALCLSTMLDSLLFVRGLQVSSSNIIFAEEEKLNRPDFINVYKFALSHGYEI